MIREGMTLYRMVFGRYKSSTCSSGLNKYHAIITLCNYRLITKSFLKRLFYFQENLKENYIICLYLKIVLSQLRNAVATFHGHAFLYQGIHPHAVFFVLYIPIGIKTLLGHSINCKPGSMPVLDQQLVLPSSGN